MFGPILSEYNILTFICEGIHLWFLNTFVSGMKRRPLRYNKTFGNTRPMEMSILGLSQITISLQPMMLFLGTNLSQCK